ncbi:PadR family transcriptional regulator [Aeromicrobium duanguangcaii]|uniref:PadR family transcriptional regulator n=1 Tax=Aeromicrobium duanguangcaii TaxID=2968086 RepID=UPI002016BF12|nr:PadR family transcriptional regulator [Aeromicrobium duanguangcaii]
MSTTAVVVPHREGTIMHRTEHRPAGRPRHPHRSRRSGPRDFDWELGPGRSGRGGRRGRKGGDVRAAALLLLAEAPAHGYSLIQQIAARSDGAWSPSPGSIYPVLQQLEDEGLIEFTRVEGRKTASLTETGAAYVEENRDALGEPWDSEQLGRGIPAESAALNTALKSLMSAARHVMTDGSPAHQAQAAAIVADTRRRLYGLLADDES